MRLALALLLLTCWLPYTAGAQVIEGRSILLVASRDLDDPNFQQSVVLVTRHGRSPPIGVIINRPLDVRLDKLFPALPQAGKHLLHRGGPVEPEQLVFLFRSAQAAEGAIEVVDHVFISRNPLVLGELLKGTRAHEGLRVFAGFSGWAPGQLENEVRRGDWHVLPVEAKLLFEPPAGELWPQLYRRATQTTAMPARPRVAPAALAAVLNSAATFSPD